MSGHITVLAAMTGGTPMMPQTGSGGDAGFGWLLALAVGLLAAGLLLKRRSVMLND